MNILTLLREDRIEPKKAAGTYGGEYASPCPGCGGSDRFRSWPEQRDGGRWWCRRCEKSGDLIQYLRDIRSLSYWKALEVLGMQHNDRKSMARRVSRGGTLFQPKPATIPPDAWLKNAKDFVTWAESNLMAEAGEEVRKWLKEERGLTEETAKAVHLGWNSQDWYPSRGGWGLPEELKENGNPKRLSLPTGLVIPKIANGEVLRVRIRRAVPYQGSRYHTLPGSDIRPLVIPGGDGKVVMVVESDLDAILIHQEGGDLATTIALGSAQLRPDQAAMEVLKRSTCILLALDADQAGAKEAWGWWKDHLQQARRWPPIKGKDITEMFLAGVSVREWIQKGVQEYSTPSVPAAASGIDLNTAPLQSAPELRLRDTGIQ
jgi:DNA primase